MSRVCIGTSRQLACSLAGYGHGRCVRCAVRDRPRSRLRLPAFCVANKGTRCAHDKLAWPEAHADSPPSSLRVEEYSACGCARHETSSVHAAAALCDPRLAVSLAPVPRRLTGIRRARRHQHQHHHSASGLHQAPAPCGCGVRIAYLSAKANRPLFVPYFVPLFIYSFR